MVLSKVSIHAPWEGCDQAGGSGIDLGVQVSIHAPWEGCDSISLRSRSRVTSFNSRTLGRVRLYTRASTRWCNMFQFTHPGKGATRKPKQRYRPMMFQFTHPGKGATGEEGTKGGKRKFQFTHPGKGATRIELVTGGSDHVSIHAPWEGCDCRTRAGSPQDRCFNSRTLGRVRHFSSYLNTIAKEFQFTHPGKGATVWCKVAYYRADKQA